MSLKGFPQNIDISPDNWEELKLVKDFTNRRNGVEVEIGDFRLEREGYEAIIEWIASQGIFENPEAYFTAPDGEVYNMFLNMRSIDIGLDDVSMEIKMRKSNDHFFERMDWLTWELLRQEGFITDNMLIDFPYLVVPDDLREQRAIQLITLASILFQLYISIKEIADVSSLLLNFTNAAVFVAQVISLGLYLALTIASLLETGQNLQELYFPFVRYFKCISDLDLMKAACAREGYTFISDFMENERAGVYSIGRPDPNDVSIFDQLDNFFAQQNTYLNFGYPRSYDTGGANAGALFNEYLENYDVDLFIYDGTVRLERSSFFENNATVNVKPTLTNQDNNDDRHTFNFEESWGRKYFRWSNDENDAHSKDVNRGDVRFEAITTQINTINQDLVELNGLNEYIAPYALVKRKDGYTKTELFFRIVLSDISNILVQLGSNNPAFQNFATERIGVGIFEKDYWTVTRKVFGTPEFDNVTGRTVLRQPADFLDYLGQDAIDATFNQGLRVNANTFRNKELNNLPWTSENFTSLLQNNRVNYVGEPEGAKVLRIEYFPFQYYCTLTVELKSDAGNNTQTIIL